MGQWYTLVRDVDATKKFWIMLGGVPIKIDGTDVMKFPGVFVFLAKGTPTGGSRGTPVNHVGFGALSVQKLFAKINAEKATDVKVRQPDKSPLNGQDVGDVYSPDDLMIEITEEAGVAPYPHVPPGVTIESNHIHFFVDEASPLKAQAWYAEMFGFKSGVVGPSLAGDLPGLKFWRFGKCGGDYSACPATGPAPTKGRALDHVGFEVKNLQEFCKKLEAKGVKLDAPYSKTRYKSFASAELTDPWGTSIELTEGLNRF